MSNQLLPCFCIREIKQEEYPLLEDFIYEAIFIPEGVEPPDKSIIQHPDIQVYIEDFGAKQDDICVVAEVVCAESNEKNNEDEKINYENALDKNCGVSIIVGAAWVRIMDDFGHVDEETPSLAVSLCKEYRGLGVGTAMMKELLSLLKIKGYKKTSLAVQKANYALKMYKNLGYEIIDENEQEYIMIKYL